MTSDAGKAVVVGVRGGFVEADLGLKTVMCKIRGKLRLKDDGIVAGDLVCVVWKDGEPLIEEVMPRRNYLIRPPVANVDLVVIFTPLVMPDADLMLTDRLCVLAEKQGLEIVICATKADIADSLAPVRLNEHYSKTGYGFISAAAPQGKGVDRLKERLDGKVSIFAGQSGAGKSTLINAILPGMNLKTGAVSEKIGRGKHTTRHVRLIRMDGGYVADSPGFSSLDLEEVGQDDLRGLMPDIASYEGRCRFNGCRHAAEPGCSVKNAIAEGLLPEGRYRHYLAFLAERAEAEKRKYD